MNENTLSIKQEKPLTLNTLKYIAIIAMVIDHIAWAFIPYTSWVGVIMHTIGRITGPVMFYSAVEGYHHTRNIKKYLFRLGIFALISQIPYRLFSDGGNIDWSSILYFNVIFVIFMGVLAIHIRHSIKNPILKVLLIFIAIIPCTTADWGALGFLIILVFDIFYGNFKNQAYGYSLIILLNTGLLSMLLTPFVNVLYGGFFYLSPDEIKNIIIMSGHFLPLILLSLYNGKKGGTVAIEKWFFYIFYPAHLLIIGLILKALNWA